jgi:hypothetical protein
VIEREKKRERKEKKKERKRIYTTQNCIDKSDFCVFSRNKKPYTSSNQSVYV